MELRVQIAGSINNCVIVQEHIWLGMLDFEGFFFIVDYWIDATCHANDTDCSRFKFEHSTFFIRAKQGFICIQDYLHMPSSRSCRLRTSKAHATNTFLFHLFYFSYL